MQSAQRKELIFNLLWFACVIALLCTVDSAFADPGYDDGAKFKEVCNKSLKYLSDDGFGALLSAGAGLGAVIAAATGSFRAAWGLLVVSVGAFILKNYVELWFQEC